VKGGGGWFQFCSCKSQRLMIANIKTICQQIQNTEAGFDVYSNRPQTDIDMKAETGPGEGGNENGIGSHVPTRVMFLLYIGFIVRHK